MTQDIQMQEPSSYELKLSYMHSVHKDSNGLGAFGCAQNQKDNVIGVGDCLVNENHTIPENRF